MNKRIKELAEQAGMYIVNDEFSTYGKFAEKFAKLIVEETLKEVDERVYGRGENQWYYDDDKKWIRLYFGYGELHDTIKKS